jgi:hypothetical protein
MAITTQGIAEMAHDLYATHAAASLDLLDARESVALSRKTSHIDSVVVLILSHQELRDQEAYYQTNLTESRRHL